MWGTDLNENQKWNSKDDSIKTEWNFEVDFKFYKIEW